MKTIILITCILTASSMPHVFASGASRIPDAIKVLEENLFTSYLAGSDYELVHQGILEILEEESPMERARLLLFSAKKLDSEFARLLHGAAINTENSTFAFEFIRLVTSRGQHEKLLEILRSPMSIQTSDRKEALHRFLSGRQISVEEENFLKDLREKDRLPGRELEKVVSILMAIIPAEEQARTKALRLADMPELSGINTELSHDAFCFNVVFYHLNEDISRVIELIESISVGRN